MPARGLLQGLAKDVAAELDDEPGLLGEWDEVLRREAPAGRMVPAQQRLEACKLVGSKAGNRLIEDGDLLPIERHAELALERQAALVLAAHGGVEDLDAVGAGALGAQHGDLAVPQHFLRRGLRAVVHHDADGRGQNDLLGADLHGRAQRAADPLGECRDVVRIAVGDEQDGELVAAETRQRVLRIEMAAEPAAER